MVVFRASSSKGKGKPSSGNEDDTDFDALLQEHPKKYYSMGRYNFLHNFFFEFYSLGYHVKEKRFSFSFFCLTFLLSPSFLDDTE